MNRLPDRPLNPEQQSVADEVMAGRGRLPTPYKVWIASPVVARAMLPLGRLVAAPEHVSKAEAEIAILAAVAHWHGEYVLRNHAREAEAAGLSPTLVEALVERRAAEPVDERQRVIVSLMAALVAPGEPSQETFDEVVNVLGDAGVAELLVAAGYFTAVALAMKLYAV